MNKNFWVNLALFFSIVALILSAYSFTRTGGFDKLKNTLLQLEFKMETKKYLLEAKAHLLEAKALYNFKKEPSAALKEILVADEFLQMAKLTAAPAEIKTIEEINSELIALEAKIKSGEPMKENFLDKTLNFLDKFFNLVKK